MTKNNINSESKQTVESFFRKFPLAEELTLPDAEYFLLYLWMRGFKVVPMFEEEEGNAN